MKCIGAALLTAGLLFEVAAQAKDTTRTEDIRFPAGKTGATIRGAIVGRESVSYKIGAEAGQTMTVALKPSNRATYFNVYEPGRGPGDEALAVSDGSGPMTPDLNRFHGKLPSSGVYTISVYMLRSAARRNARSSFTLKVSISAVGDPAQRPPVQADFADGLQGGPDYWAVAGVPAGDALNLRRGPSAAAAIVMRFDNGAVLRNKGCRMIDGQRWCRVERPQDSSVSGWAAGRFLHEGSAPPQDDALVARTPFHATGDLPCARHAGQPMGPCKFGVARAGAGSAAVTVFWPDGGARLVYFEKGEPVRSDRPQADGGGTLSFDRKADLFVLTIGDERFEIPEAVISGG